MEMTNKREAERYYKRYIAPKESEFNTKLEFARQKSNKRVLPALLMGLAAVATVVYFSFWFSTNNSGFGGFSEFFWSFGFIVALIAGLVSAIAGYIYVTLPLDSQKQEIKRELFPVMLKYFDGSSEYYEKSPWPIQQLKWSDLLPSFDNATTEDFIRSKYKGVEFEMFEAKLTEERSRGDNKTTTDTVFDGIFLLLKIKTGFRGNIIIKRDAGFFNPVVGFFKGSFQGLNKVEISNWEFEDKFEIFSDHPEQARSFLNSSLLSKLMTLVKDNPDEKLAFHMTEDKILISLENTKDKFELTIGEQVDLIDSFYNVIMEMERIYKVIDAFEPVNHNRYY